MIYERSTLAVAIFAVFVGITLGLSFYLGRRAKSASGYFAAGGGIHWFVNGIAFAGDYLSASREVAGGRFGAPAKIKEIGRASCRERV